jgi:hypothetical protein
MRKTAGRWEATKHLTKGARARGTSEVLRPALGLALITIAPRTVGLMANYKVGAK